MLISPCFPKSQVISLESTSVCYIIVIQQTFCQNQDTPREGSLLLYPILGVNFFLKLTPRTFNPFFAFYMFPPINHPHSKLNDAQVSKGHLHLTKNLNLD